MASLSKRAKRHARTKRENSKLHRAQRKLLQDVSPVIRRGNVEGQLLRALLKRFGGFVLPMEALSSSLGGEIDVSPIPGTEDYEIRYLPTPVEASKAGDASEASKPVADEPAEPVYAEPEAAV